MVHRMNLISSGGVYSSVKSVSDEVEGIDTRVETLEEGEIYSTTEKVIGKWIDGKPIYRRVFSLTLTPSGSSIIDSNPIYKNVISLQGKMTIAGVSYPIANSRTGAGLVVNVTDNNQLRQLNNEVTYADIIVEYTKTTD